MYTHHIAPLIPAAQKTTLLWLGQGQTAWRRHQRPGQPEQGLPFWSSCYYSPSYQVRCGVLPYVVLCSTCECLAQEEKRTEVPFNDNQTVSRGKKEKAGPACWRLELKAYSTLLLPCAAHSRGDYQLLGTAFFYDNQLKRKKKKNWNFFSFRRAFPSGQSAPWEGGCAGKGARGAERPRAREHWHQVDK